MPKLALKDGGYIATSDTTELPTSLTVKDASGRAVTVELADLPEVEKAVQLIEDPDGFEEEHASD